MNPILVFFFLGVFQIAIAAIGCIVAFIVTMAPGRRAARRRAIWASLFGAGGGFVGVIIAYFLIMAVGLGWKVVELFRLVSPAIILAEISPWVLVASYIVGLMSGSYIGWKIRMPVSGQSAEL